MELSLESDAEALWQDALDLLAAQQRVPESVLAMLRNCRPESMTDGVLHVTTPMRLVLKTVSKNAGVVEECLTQAAFEPMRLEISFAPAQAAAPAQAPASSMSREEARAWMADVEGTARAAEERPTPRSIAESTPAKLEIGACMEPSIFAMSSSLEGISASALMPFASI